MMVAETLLNYFRGIELLHLLLDPPAIGNLTAGGIAAVVAQLHAPEE